MKVSKFYKEVKFNDQVKIVLIREAIDSDQGMFQFEFLRKADTYEKFRKNCLGYADNQSVLASQHEQISDQTKSRHQEGEETWARSRPKAPQDLFLGAYSVSKVYRIEVCTFRGWIS